jgi:hypothetical protein
METTFVEKFLAFVLAAFLLIGGLWAYAQPLDRTEGGSFDGQAPGLVGTSADRAAIDRHERADRGLRREARRRATARQRLELAREEYRTALDAGTPTPALERRYQAARRAFARAEAAVAGARQRERSLAPAVDAASARLRAAEERSFQRGESRRTSRARETFALRLAWVLACLAAAFWLFNRQRRAHSRYLPAGMAAVGAATVQALVMAGDYTTDYIDVTELGPLVLSVVGIALTLAAFAGLQRFLARRVPQRRVRRRECPFCGFPVTGGEHCEGCGREVVAACATCDAPRRVGTPYCAACGQA